MLYYPVTIQDEDLRQAFLSIEGVQNLIAKIVDSVYTAAEYDEFLLFKYLLIKAISHGKMFPISTEQANDLTDSAVKFRGTSNLLPFMSSNYNEAGVKTNTPKDRQVISWMQHSMQNLMYLFLLQLSTWKKQILWVDCLLLTVGQSLTTKRFDVIRENSDGIEEITTAELNLMKDVKAVLLDENWFQVYDNNNKFTEKYVASGLYWNYFYHTWKTVSYSPFANAVVFVQSTAKITLPTKLTVEIISKDHSEDATVFALSADTDGASLEPNSVHFVQDESATTNGIAIQKYGAVIIPASKSATEITLVAEVNGQTYTGATSISSASNVGDTVTMNKA